MKIRITGEDLNELVDFELNKGSYYDGGTMCIYTVPDKDGKNLIFAGSVEHPRNSWTQEATYTHCYYFTAYCDLRDLIGEECEYVYEAAQR